jgi:ankyrin repeat protein
MRTLRVLPSRGGGDRVEALRRAMVGSMRFGNGPGKRDAATAGLEHGDDRERENELAARATRIANANAALLAAVTRGDINSVQQQLDAGAQANVKNAHGTPVLVLASESGYTEIVNALLARRADANARDRFDWTALMMAFDHPATTKALLDGGADPNIMVDDGFDGACALTLAISTVTNYGDRIEDGNVETVDILLAHGADPNILSYEYQHTRHPIWTNALIDGNVAITIALLKGGAQPRLIDTGNPTFDEAVLQLGGLDGVKDAHVEWLRALPISSPAIKPSWIVTLPATDPTRQHYERWLRENAPLTDALVAEYERLCVTQPGRNTKAAGR